MSVLPEKFLGRLSIGDGCWEWQGDKYRNGYGKYYWGQGEGGPGKHILAHRFIYQHMVGPIANVINHLCENKACVRPDHLEDVTQQENFRYSVSDNCPAGHDITRGNNPNVWVDPKTNKRKCHACMRASKKRAYARDPGKNNARTRDYYARNREAVLEQAREHYAKNREAILARRRARKLAAATKEN